jgi:glycosyltransferase involved in cell wall biosynthesis
MRVGVILVTYGRAHVLPATIESILNQTLVDFELLISDDCSPDETEAVCRAFVKSDSRVTYRRNPTRLGMPGNLNSALMEVPGDLIANLHDSDLCDPSLLEQWRDALIQCPRAAFVFNAYRHLSADGSVREVTSEPLPPCFPGRVLLEAVYFRRWRFDSPVWGTVMARRSAYDRVGHFDERFGFYADVAMWMRLAEEFDVAYVNEPLLTLPSRELVPRLFSLSRRDEARTLHKIFWEARMRHHRGRPVRRAIEGVRHGAFVATSAGMEHALRAKRALTSAAGAARDSPR